MSTGRSLAQKGLSEVWKEGGFNRNVFFKNSLFKTLYKTADDLAAARYSLFPVIDFLDNGTGIAFRAVDDFAAAETGLKKAIDDLAKAKQAGCIAGATGEVKVTSARLEIGVPNGASTTLPNEISVYAKSKGITVRAFEISEEGGKIVAKLAKTGSKAFKEITTDVRAALNRRIEHIYKIKFEPKGSGYRFSGCHSKNALNELGTNARIEITIPKNTEGVYEAKIYATGPDGKEIMKSGNGGKSTFFPDNWDEVRILDEVEFAVKNNKGLVPNGASNQYFGFSKNGKIKIEFYYNETTGDINSFFPSLNSY